MLKCPFCHYDNEDGALFCEQCKSDLSSAGTPAPAVPVAHAEPIPVEVPEAVPYEAIPLAADEVIPMAGEPLAAIPLEAHAETVDYAHAEPVAEAVPIEEPQLAPHTPPPQAAPVHPAPQPAAPPAPAAHAAPPPPAQAAPAVQAPPPPPPPPAPAPVAAAPAPAAPAAAAPTAGLPPGAQPRLLVLRGQRRNVEYPIYEGLNFIGRADEKPVDIDLEDQEPPDRVWCSRQHACISLEGDQLAVEDLNSANGTYVNRNRIYPGQKRSLAANDIIQIGNVQLKVVV